MAHNANGRAYAYGDNNGNHVKAANGAARPDAAALLRNADLEELLVLLPSIAEREAVLEAVLQDRALASSAQPARVHFSFGSLLSRAKAAALLTLVLYSLPVSLLLTAAVVLRHCQRLLQRGQGEELWQRLRAGLSERRATRGTALVSGAKSTKGLHVCRHLHRAGWRVVLVDTHKNWASGSRFSWCVAGFRTTPIPNKDPVGYLKTLRAIAVSEKASLFVPVSIAQFSVYEALAAELIKPLGCACCTLDVESVAVLNDKIKFSAFCERIGMRVPRSFPITSCKRLYELNSRSEVFDYQDFLLKSIHYAATHRVDQFTLPCDPEALKDYTRTLDISAAAPWQLQQMLKGREFSCNTIAHEGRVVAHADNEACLSCLYYNHVGEKQIYSWVEQFCKRTNASGQLCFDFMLNKADGHLYAFECNPRTSSVLLEYHDHPAFAEALCNPEGVLASGKAPIEPLPGSPPVYWFWNEVGELAFGALPRIARSIYGWWYWLGMWDAREAAVETFARLRGGVDAVLDPEDPLPFLALHYGQVPLLLLRAIRFGNPWIKVDLCTGKLVELGGD
ncbi:hypothetical protein WJX81_005430 [Elliptochloris bilobata]|uniref:ATP-grasp domain-containing protein n=1 Tax=Elliptochloris bilobata TaxID=381761 RepID=A0AAW1RD49_9CHLO